MVSGHVIPELEAFTVGTSVMLNSRHRSLPCTPAIGQSSEIEMDRWLMSRHESVRVTMLYNPVPFLSESHFLIWHGKKLLQSCDSARILTFPNCCHGDTVTQVCIRLRYTTLVIISWSVLPCLLVMVSYLSNFELVKVCVCFNSILIQFLISLLGSNSSVV